MNAFWNAVDGDIKMPLDKDLLFCVVIGNVSEPVYIPGRAKKIRDFLEPDYTYKISGREESYLTAKFWMELHKVPSWDYPEHEDVSL